MSEELNVIKNMGLLAWDAYENNLRVDGTFSTRLPGYQVLAFSPESSNGFQALLLQKVDPETQGSDYVFAFRGTEIGMNLFETWRDAIQTDLLGMGLQQVPGQFLEAIMFVQEQMAAHPELNQQNTTLTGHSLGGSIATAVSYTFGMQAYDFNPFGIAGNELFQSSTIGEIFTQIGESLVPPDTMETGQTELMAAILGLDPVKFAEFMNSTQTVTGIVTDNVNVVTVGQDFQELVSGGLTDIVGGLIGSFNPVMDYDGGSLGGAVAHGIADLNQGIAVYNNLLSLLPQEDYTSLSSTLAFVPGEDPVRNFLLALGDIVGAGNLSSLGTVAIAQQLAETGNTDLQLINLGEQGDSQLSNLAKVDKAIAYALLNLNTFAVTGFDYSNHAEVSDQSLAEISGQYWDDRALFLYQLTHPAAASFTGKHLEFSDLPSGITAESLDSYDEFSNVDGTSTFLFGGDSSELIEGSGDENHLYGMGGDDVLAGGYGNDYLEGGQGQDTLNGGSGDDILDELIPGT